MLAARLERLIPDATGIIAVIIMVCAFMLSFANLQAGAIQAGISPWLSWAWPLCVDALLVTGSLIILRSSLRQESTRFGWTVVIVFTAVSVAFNIAHSPEDLTSRAAHAVPPVTLMVSIEMFTMIIRSDLYLESNASLPTSGPVEHSPVQLPPIEALTRVQEPDKIQPVTDADIIRVFAENPGISKNRAAITLGLPKTSLYRRMARLEESGQLVRAGIPDYIVSRETERNIETLGL